MENYIRIYHMNKNPYSNFEKTGFSLIIWRSLKDPLYINAFHSNHALNLAKQIHRVKRSDEEYMEVGWVIITIKITAFYYPCAGEQEIAKAE